MDSKVRILVSSPDGRDEALIREMLARGNIEGVELLSIAPDARPLNAFDLSIHELDMIRYRTYDKMDYPGDAMLLEPPAPEPEHMRSNSRRELVTNNAGTMTWPMPKRRW